MSTDTKVYLSAGVYADFFDNGELFGVFIDTTEWLKALADFEDTDAEKLQEELDKVYARDEFKYAYDYKVWGQFCAEKKLKADAWTNTYNYDNELDNVLEYAFFDYWDEEYVAIRLHMGGDVRGNYDHIRIGRVYEGNISERIGVHVGPPVEPQDEKLFDTGPVPEGEYFYSPYEFGKWCEAEGLELDWTDRAKPKLSDGRNVYFDNPDIY